MIRYSCKWDDVSEPNAETTESNELVDAVLQSQAKNPELAGLQSKEGETADQSEVGQQPASEKEPKGSETVSAPFDVSESAMETDDNFTKSMLQDMVDSSAFTAAQKETKAVADQTGKEPLRNITNDQSSPKESNGQITDQV